jgi:hypothetical protein
MHAAAAVAGEAFAAVCGAAVVPDDQIAACHVWIQAKSSRVAWSQNSSNSALLSSSASDGM